ncbi:hypothetical protein K8640_30005 [Myxococcus sp. XM-1-1-1]|jgi:hypothetical protein|uniref:hypothetical protein n=1 Tax=Myxococcus sp. XM-1-1-1 TaxID=2874602 RepID=UPI001CC056E8|nr:hypothetical protein [Myxococcus sp. XM-1-1-1]MBZ4412466.1 hypothetical protein [Myxococcus sp. XM-1-1-1]BDT33790.1 hypothetical protein MFMH1_34590 [Myxococcus sp. MH1]
MSGAEAQTPSSQAPANACYLWKGRGGNPTQSYMVTHASCRPWNRNHGWSFIQTNNGVDYYRGTFEGAAATPSLWAVYADFGSAVLTTQADYDAFIANTRLSGSCADCLP